jgi:hypothetical protein
MRQKFHLIPIPFVGYKPGAPLELEAGRSEQPHIL